MALRHAVLLCAALTVAPVALAAPAREVSARPVDIRTSLPDDLLRPEGKSRWHLESLTVGPAVKRTLDESAAGLRSGTSTFAGADASRFLMPDRDPSQMKMGARVVLDFSESKDALADSLQARVETIGIGWAHLPAGAREVVLQRVVVFRRGRADVFAYRWVDAHAGVVAEVSGPASSDGTRMVAVAEASVVDEILLGGSGLKIYSDELERGTYIELKYGWNKGAGATVASLVPNPGITNICDLVALNSWDFSGTTTGQETAFYQTPVNAAETCNSARCGYTVPNGILGREDRNITGTLRKDNQVTERENRPGDVTVWLRAGTQNENVAGIFGSGESGFCFTSAGAVTRKPVPLWRFSHNDADGWYLQDGDSWQSDPIDQPGECQETFYTTRCGATQPLTPNPLYARACTTSGQTHLGKQSIEVEKEGVVTLPSGHTLNALVVRNMTDFCVYSGSACSSPLDRVRTLVYYWQVPYLGSVVLLRSPRTVNYTATEITAGATHPCTNFTTLDYTNIAFGLFPPLSITAGTATDTSVQLSWSPGNDVHRITDYKIYWDTDSGSSSGYAFNSVTNAGQVAFAGTTATISGLTPGTTYYFTVTSRSAYTDPSSGVLTTYESIVYPTTVSGDPTFAYPVEVQKATTGGTCIPTQAVAGLTIDKAGANIHVCWQATSDVCAVGYDVLGSASANTDAGYSVAGSTGLTTCWDGTSASTYFLVRSRGTGGDGPWGHYGH